MARLNIPDEPTSVSFTVTAAATVFPFDFAIFEKADLQVAVDDVILPGSAYTLAGALLDGGGYQGGTVTLTTAVENCTVVVSRNIKPQRASGFGAVASVPVGSIDQALNRTMAIAQDLRRRQDAVELGAIDPIALAGKADTAGDTFTGPTAIQGEFQLRALDDGTEPPPVGVYFGTGGNSLSFQTLVSSPDGAADSDNQRAQFLIVNETMDDGNSEEQALCILQTIRTGYSKEWANSTAFSVGDNVSFPAPRNTVYRCIQAGTSAASGTGPTGQGQSIADGTVVWRWINDAAINAKLAFYNEVVVEPGAGSSWAHVNNFDIKPGVLTKFACNTELDLTNNSGIDSTTANGFNRLGLWIAAQGASRSTAGLQVSSANTANDALLWGAYFAGARLATNAVIGIDASAQYGIGIGDGAGGVLTPTFGVAVMKDVSIAPNGIELAGSYAGQAFLSSGVTPASFVSVGAKSLAGFFDTSTSPYGLRLDGTYSASPLHTSLLPPFADDAAAAAGGLPVGAWYRTDNTPKQRIA